MLNHQFAEQVKRDREREIRQRIRDRRQRSQLAPQSTSVRRAVGRSIIEIGHRIAAEPRPRLARSR
jgi:hypothetical protein